MKETTTELPELLAIEDKEALKQRLAELYPTPDDVPEDVAWKLDVRMKDGGMETWDWQDIYGQFWDDKWRPAITADIEDFLERSKTGVPLDKDCLPLDWEGGKLYSEYVGQLANPSGKYYLPFACSNVNTLEAAEDEVWEELWEEIGSPLGVWLETGEGDPTDKFLMTEVGEEEGEEGED